MTKSAAGGENVNEDNISEWINSDINDPGFVHKTGEEIITLNINLEKALKKTAKCKKSELQCSLHPHWKLLSI